MTVILSWSWNRLLRHFKSALFLDDSSLSSGLGKSLCYSWFILSDSRIGVGLPNVLASKSHILVAVAKWLEVPVILARRWHNLTVYFVAAILDNQRCLGSWLGETLSLMWLVITSAWI